MTAGATPAGPNKRVAMTITTALPVHPSTGLTAAGLRRDGRPIWPIAGAADPDPANPPAQPPPADPPPAAPPKPTDPPPPADPPGDPAEDALPEGAKKALAAARKDAREAEKARKAAEARVKEFEDRDKSDLDKATERAAAAEKRAADAEAASVRLRVIGEVGLPAELHEFLPAGGDEAVLRAQAEKLKAAVGAKPRVPAPDGSQGSKAPTGLDEQIAAAQKAGNYREVIALQRQKLNT
jgi:hypothetical protein